MRVPRLISALPLLAGALVLTLFPAGCSDDDNPVGGGGGGGGTGATIPASWGGTWQITSVQTPPPAPGRGSGTEIGITSLCAGFPVEELLGLPDEAGDIPVTCTGAWTDSAVDVTCTASTTIEGCTITYSQTLRLNRNGETFSGTVSGSITYTGSCADLEDEVFSDDIDAVRLDTEQFGCDLTLERALPTSWGGTWNISETPGERGGGSNELLCPGEDIDQIFWDFQQDVDAVGGFTETTAQVFGSYTESAGQCLELVTEQYDLTRTGESFSGTRTRKIYTVEDPNGAGGGGCSGEQTEVVNINATRIDTDVSACTRGAALPELRQITIDDLRQFPASRR